MAYQRRSWLTIKFADLSRGYQHDYREDIMRRTGRDLYEPTGVRTCFPHFTARRMPKRSGIARIGDAMRKRAERDRVKRLELAE